MNEVSNKTLALLLIVAIAISLGGTVISLNRLAGLRFPMITGFASDTGTASVEITETASAKFSIEAVDFLDGWVNQSEGGDTCEITAIQASSGTESAPCYGNWAAGLGGLQIENDGNQLVSMTIKSSKNGTNLVGIPGGAFRFMAHNNETGSCTILNASMDDEWYAWVKNTEHVICGNLNYNNSKDSMWVDLNLSINFASNMSGEVAQTATITLTATGI
ncbi:MAG: hypothetical protein ABIG95_04500 [Candidatus Woesearchaeota archaeon]